jgi:hypothetical protein
MNMDTRQLLVRIAEVLNWDSEEELDLAEGPKDRLRRRGDMSYFNPSPQEILAATLSIQAGWTERERMVRAARSCGPRRWRVPQVRILGMSEPEE